jgi:uncharacterized membrane protein YqjE
MSSEAAPPRLFGSVRALVATLIGLAGTRLQLAGVELAEEKQRLLGALGKLLAAMLFGAMAVLVFSFLVVAYFWETHRWAALAGLALAYLALGAGLALNVRREFQSHPPLFEATAAELEKDRAYFEQALKDE